MKFDSCTDISQGDEFVCFSTNDALSVDLFDISGDTGLEKFIEETLVIIRRVGKALVGDYVVWLTRTEEISLI